jgi:diguanylate cyclase (GGDEF)-like protein/PAS domain S-box-containing protein
MNLPVVSFRSFDGTARQLVYVAVALTAYVVIVSVGGSRLAISALRDSASETARVDAYATARLRLDVVFDQSVDLAQAPSRKGLASLDAGFHEFERAVSQAQRVPQKDEDGIQTEILNADLEAEKLAEASTPAECESRLLTLTREERRLDMITQGLSRRAVMEKMAADARRLWIYGMVLPATALFGFLVIACLILPRALRRIRGINLELVRLQEESQAQAHEVEARNAELRGQQALLKEKQGELIMKTEELEGTSISSQAAARRFEELFQGLPVACIGFAEEGLIYEWNRASTELFGLEAFEVLGQPVWDHIADGRYRRRATSLMEKVFRGEGIKDMDWTFKCKNGDSRRVMGRLFPMRGLNGSILGAVLACIDVTERHLATQELRASEKLFRDLIDSLHEGVVLYDGDGKVVMANRQATNLLTQEQTKVHGLSAQELYPGALDAQGAPLDPADLPENICSTKGQAVEDAIIGLPLNSGEDSAIRWLSTNVISLRRPDEERAYGVLSSFSDVTDRLAYEAQLNALAISDGLTGLFNHRAFQEKLELLLALSADIPVSLILIDVDNFKDYNDSFGHPEGDRVLRQVAARLREASGDGCVVARYGGEEFAVIAPGYDALGARRLANELCHRVANAEWPNRHVTISLGVSTSLQSTSGDPATLIRLADEALYKSKHHGRNRATHCDDVRRAA